MTGATPGRSVVEYALTLLMLSVFWLAFGTLAGGLAMWTIAPADAAGVLLLRIGLIGLLVMPTIRLALVVAAAIRARDRLTLAATLAVLAILAALTLRDALRFSR